MSTIFDRSEIQRNCDEFYSLYKETRGMTYNMCLLKIVHTRFVAENCVSIAKYLGMNEYDTDLAWIIGELHDFARFGQIVVTKTFRDSERFNHAKFGSRLLFQHGLITDIILNYDEVCEADRIVMEKAIYHHSDFCLPENLTERQRVFCELIREADQIDIFRTIVTSGWEPIYGCSKEEILNSDISPEIEAAFYRHQLADYSKRTAPADYHLAHIALCFGLKTTAARQRAKEQGYLLKMMDIRFHDAKVQEKYESCKKCVEEWLQ